MRKGECSIQKKEGGIEVIPHYFLFLTEGVFALYPICDETMMHSSSMSNPSGYVTGVQCLRYLFLPSDLKETDT